jgi:hypothetical protein
VRQSQRVLCHTEDGLFALKDKCPHVFQPLAGGNIDEGVIACPQTWGLQTDQQCNQQAREGIRYQATWRAD